MNACTEIKCWNKVKTKIKNKEPCMPVFFLTLGYYKNAFTIKFCTNLKNIHLK